MAELILKGVKQNNLKDVDVTIPLGESVVITGPSGSGKSSLAFETIYAEGQRRYMQSLSTYARQFLEKFRAPHAQSIHNIPPTIALEQINPVRNSRATVGTTTEIYDYLRLLFEKVGKSYCVNCKIPMVAWSVPKIADDILKKAENKTILVTFSKILEGSAKDRKAVLEDLLRQGFTRTLVNGKIVPMSDLLAAKKTPDGNLILALDRIRVGSASPETITRVSESVRAAFAAGNGKAEAFIDEGDHYLSIGKYAVGQSCPKCFATAPQRSAAFFSFNSPLGACESCKGFGNILDVDEDLIIPNPNLSISRGAIEPFTKPSLRAWQKKLLAFCKNARIDVDLPYRELPEKTRRLVFDGTEGWKGVRGVFKELEEERYKLRIRVFISRFTSPFTCPSCHGTRLKAESRSVRVAGKTITDLTSLPLNHLENFFRFLQLEPRDKEIATDVLNQLRRRLEYLETVGLGYLTLDRLTKTLSGGEYQRILLATQLSQGLTDTLYVLDEPSIGLHPKDTQRLISVLAKLRVQGNSLLVVEHDPEIIDWAEHVIDMGPGSGTRGGEVIFSGTKERFLLSECATANAVKSWKQECARELLRNHPNSPTDWIEIRGATGNNLKNVDVSIPLNRVVTITGVSGSGKSTLIEDTLYRALAKIFQSSTEKISRFQSIRGFEHLSGVELIDQSAIGRSSRSNPITFTKGYDEVRQLFAETKEARERGLTPGHFSFNIPGGRCETCEGEGRVAVDMVFLEDVWVPCETCSEKRFKPNVLSVRYRGKNIDDVLKMTIDEAYHFFETSGPLRTKLAILREVGLGYLQLGQPGYTLSGGEAQRLKISRELSQASLRKGSYLFILDEPTTGLHFQEVARLIQVVRRLVAAGHSVVIVEHNVQLICASDYLIDLGPDGGDAGGHVVAFGTPRELAEKKLPHTGAYLAEFLNQIQN